MHNLTSAQQNIWNLQKYYEGSTISAICGAVYFKGKIDTEILKRAVNHVIEHQNGLRLRFCEVNGKAMQRVEEYQYEKIPFLQVSDKEALRQYILQHAQKLTGLTDRPLYYFAIFQLNGQIGIVTALSHLISDAWTLSLITRQISDAYEALTQGALRDGKVWDYLEHVHAEEEYHASIRYEKDADYWRDKYPGKPEETAIKPSAAPAVYATVKRVTRALGCELTELAAQFCRETSITPAVLFETVITLYLSKINPENKAVTIGTLVLGRYSAREKNTAGMFISTLPLTIPVSASDTVEALANRITDSHRELFRHQRYPYSNILRQLREKDDFTGNLYDVMFSYQNAQTGIDAETEWFSNGYSEIPLAIHIDNRDNGSSYTWTVDYQAEVFRHEAEIRLIIDRLEHILRQIITNYKVPTDKISIIPDAEYQRIMFDFNDTAADYPGDKCVHTLFEEQVERMADKTAVIACDRTLTYRELNEQANRIAHSLIDQGVKPGDIVAFALPRRSYLIATMFGILKAGAAYLPIDPDYPQDRINYMLEDSKAAYLITEETIQKLLKNEDIADPMLPMTSDSLCYCIYTSGSTGRPKGTLLRHRGIVNLVTNLSIYHDLSKCKRIGFMTTITFDVATQEIFTALLNGFTGVLVAERRETSTEEIISRIQEDKIDVIYATPTYLDALTDSTKKAEKLLAAVKVICLAGEKFYLNHHALSLKDQYPIAFENQYGPAETHVTTATTMENYSDITIGKPIANIQIYILDAYRRVVPTGVTGELCIAGDGVGAGYLNSPELTAEKFIDNPFGEGKLYKTGDLAYWREDGNIVYVGRNDFQVKIRGLRIELGEIENAMQSVDGIVQAVVVVRKNGEGRQLICAFYTGDEISAKDIRSQIGQRLPKYMLPHIFMRLDEMPLTSSGKVNRKALPEVDLSVISSMVEYAAPVGEFEKRLASLMEQALNYSPIGRNNDFFDLGCDSLKAIEFLSKAHGEGIYFDLQNVFDYPTIESLCSYLQNIPEKKNPFAPEQFEKYAPILEQNVWDENFIPNGRKLGTVFLTGSTGFLGAHILDALMKHGAQKIYCLVRGGEERLAQRLQYYFGEQYAGEIGKTIIPIVGDLVSEDNEDDWPERVEYVIHAAASVKHYGTWQYFKQTNVDATARVLAYAQKINAKLVYVSTASVSGNSLVDQFDGYVSEEEKHFYESSLYIEQSLDNVYIRSKFEAETLVLDAMLHGLHANIVRMGNLTNRVSDLKFQPNYADNAFLKRIKAILDLGCLPEYPASAYAEFTPVDAAAEAVVKITEYMNDRYTVFHVYSNRNLYFDRMLTYLTRLGHPLTVLSGAEFAGRIQATLNTAHEYIFEALSNQLNLDDMLQFDSNIHIENSFTVQYLRNVGFEWPEIDYVYIEGYLQYFEKLGYIGGVVHDAE